ncbi:unnamed protein product [Prunus armeniaca]
MRKMKDFKDEKVEEMVVIAKEWLGWMLECLQRLKGGRKEGGLMVARVLEQTRDVGRWLLDACSNQRMKVDGSGMTVMTDGMLAAAEER